MIRITEICKRLDISKPTMYEWIKKGCPVHYVGKLPFFDEQEVEIWIKAGVNNGNEKPNN